MLYRKIEKYIVSHLQSGSDKILIIDGARQIGKSFIIREVGKKFFPNYIEINMETDKLGNRTFADAKTVDDFYLALSTVAGDRMKEKNNTLVFIDEIQAYDHLLTLLKFLREDNKFTYIASGSLLGVYAAAVHVFVWVILQKVGYLRDTQLFLQHVPLLRSHARQILYVLVQYVKHL